MCVCKCVTFFNLYFFIQVHCRWGAQNWRNIYRRRSSSFSRCYRCVYNYQKKVEYKKMLTRKQLRPKDAHVCLPSSFIIDSTDHYNTKNIINFNNNDHFEWILCIVIDIKVFIWMSLVLTFKAHKMVLTFRYASTDNLFYKFLNPNRLWTLGCNFATKCNDWISIWSIVF